MSNVSGCNMSRQVFLEDDVVLESLLELKPKEAAIFPFFLILHLARTENLVGRFSVKFISNGINKSPSTIRRALDGLIIKKYIKRIRIDYGYGTVYRLIKRWTKG